MMRINSSYCVLWCILLFFSFRVVAQTDWQFETHSNNITGISIDGDWVWVATRDGLFKFNPQTGERDKYTSDDTNMTDDYLTDVMLMPDDSLWVSYYYFGASHASLSANLWENYEVLTSPLTSNYVRTMKLAPSGALFMGTFYGGVNIYKDGEWTFINNENSPLPISNSSGGIVQIVFGDEGNDQNVWFGTRYHGVYHQTDDTWVRYDVYNSPIPHEIVSALAIDAKKRIWIGTHDGLAIKDVDDNWQVYEQADSPLPVGFIRDLAVGNDSVVWAATLQGLVCIPTETADDFSTWIVFNTENSGLPDNRIEKVEIDTVTGDLWVGMYSHGLVRFDGASWEVFDFKDSDFVDNDVLSLNYTKDSTLLVCTLTGGLGIYKDSTWTILNQDNTDMPTNQVNFALKDSSNNIWLGYSFDGISYWDGDTMIHFNHLNSPLKYPLNIINDMYIDSLDQIWMAINGGLLEFNHLDSIWTFHEADTSGVNQDVTAIESDGDGGFWYAGRYNTLKHFDGTNIIGEYDTPDDFLKGAIVTDLVRDEWDNIWIGTGSKGLLKLDTTGGWSQFDATNSGIQGNSISSLEYTPDSMLWIGTTGVGIYAYKLGAIQHFDVYTGHLPQNNVSDLEWDPRGTLWIGMPLMGLGSHHIDIFKKPVDTLVINNLLLPFGSMTVFPNPVKNKLQVDISLTVAGKSLLALYSLDGQLLQEDIPGYLAAGKRTLRMDVSTLPAGTYFLQLTVGEKSIGQLVFKE